MPAYLIAEIDPTDPEPYAEYVKAVPPLMEQFGGRFLVRGGNPEAIEGDWTPGRLVVVEFPSKAALMEFYESDAYRPLREIRQRTTTSRLVIAEGAP